MILIRFLCIIFNRGETIKDIRVFHVYLEEKGSTLIELASFCVI